MATVIFFEKPGCINNTRQKLWLAASGHKVLSKDLLKEKWRKEELRMFFGELPVALWFNPSAPRIKSGEVVPSELDEAAALSMMVAEPLLIRRPLMKVGDICRVGFDEDSVRSWVGLNDAKPSGNLESCPKGHIAQPCPSLEKA